MSVVRTELAYLFKADITNTGPNSRQNRHDKHERMIYLQHPGQGHSLICIPWFLRGESRLDMWSVLSFAIFIQFSRWVCAFLVI